MDNWMRNGYNTHYLMNITLYSSIVHILVYITQYEHIIIIEECYSTNIFTKYEHITHYENIL